MRTLSVRLSASTELEDSRIVPVRLLFQYEISRRMFLQVSNHEFSRSKSPHTIVTIIELHQ